MTSFSLSEESKKILIKRVKSLCWRAGSMLAALFVDFVLQNIGLVDMPASIAVLLGLVLGEISKFLNSNLREIRASGGAQ